jgi:hypothetical protein
MQRDGCSSSWYVPGSCSLSLSRGRLSRDLPMMNPMQMQQRRFRLRRRRLRRFPASGRIGRSSQNGRVFTSTDSGGHWTDVTQQECGGCSLNATAFLGPLAAVRVQVAPPSAGDTQVFVTTTENRGVTWRTTILDAGAGVPIESASLSFSGADGLLALEIAHSSGVEGFAKSWSTDDAGSSWASVANLGPAVASQ